MEHSDYVAFLLPMDWLNRKITKPTGIKLYKSFKLPEANYSGVKLKCCFNIYIRGNEETKELKGVKFYRFDKGDNEEKWKELKADYRFVRLGGLRLLKEKDRLYSSEMKIVFDTKKNFKPILEKLLKEKVKNSISTPNIESEEIEQVIYDTYPELRINGGGKKIHGVRFDFYERGNPRKDDAEKYLAVAEDYRIIRFGTPRVISHNEKLRVNEMKITFEKKRNFKPILEKFLEMKRGISISSTNITTKDIEELIYDTYPDLRAN